MQTGTPEEVRWELKDLLDSPKPHPSIVSLKEKCKPIRSFSFSILDQ
jgi:hypothetical protein